MKILMFSNNYLPHTSGVGTSVTRTMRNIEKLGHEVRLIAPEFPNFKENNPLIYRVPALPLRPPVIPLAFPNIHAIKKIVENYKPDIIHTHHPFLLGKTAMRLAKKYHLPIVFTHHSIYEQYIHYVPFIPTAWLQKSVIRRVMNFANETSAVVAPSESVEKILQDRNIETPVYVIPTGINPTFFVRGKDTRKKTRESWGVGEDELLIISFARLAKEKNFSMLIDAFSLLKQQIGNTKVRLVIGGDGPETDTLKEQVAKLGLNLYVQFPGHFVHENIPDFLSGGDVFAYPSTSETQGLVTLEALAAGLPAVVSNAPGNRDIVIHETCGLVAKPNANELAAALKKVVMDSALRKELASHTIERAMQFSEEKMAQKMIVLYQSLINKK